MRALHVHADHTVRRSKVLSKQKTHDLILYEQVHIAFKECSRYNAYWLSTYLLSHIRLLFAIILGKRHVSADHSAPVCTRVAIQGPETDDTCIFVLPQVDRTRGVSHYVYAGICAEPLHEVFETLPYTSLGSPWAKPNIAQPQFVVPCHKTDALRGEISMSFKPKFNSLLQLYTQISNTGQSALPLATRLILQDEKQ